MQACVSSDFLILCLLLTFWLNLSQSNSFVEEVVSGLCLP